MMTLAQAAQVLGGKLIGADRTFTGVCTDTRTLASGDLFVALAGPRFDAHDFLVEAAKRGAVGAIVQRAVETDLACVTVEDTRLALGHLAADWRTRFSIPVVGVTGSNGKTTVKTMIGAILAERGPALATQGNLNNDIGMPLTLLKLRDEHRHAVIEMGMNHPGEIDYLTRICRPTVAVITNAAAAHLAGLGSVENVARAKGEIFAGLTSGGTAIINADDDYAGLWRELAASRRIVTFGLDKLADITASYEAGIEGTAIQFKSPQGQTTMSIPFLGRHNVMNALAAGAAALAAGAGVADIKRGLEKLSAVSGRLEIKHGLRGARVLDDTYNANPGSMTAGLEVLKSATGERVLVMGDMGELGDSAGEIHRRIGELACRLGIDQMFAVGELSRNAVAGFGTGARHFSDHDALIAALRDRMHSGMTLLVKGSRVMQMERVVAGITNGQVPGGHA